MNEADVLAAGYLAGYMEKKAADDGMIAALKSKLSSLGKAGGNKIADFIDSMSPEERVMAAGLLGAGGGAAVGGAIGGGPGAGIGAAAGGLGLAGAQAYDDKDKLKAIAALKAKLAKEPIPSDPDITNVNAEDLKQRIAALRSNDMTQVKGAGITVMQQLANKLRSLSK